jgi:TolA-binding protein
MRRLTLVFLVALGLSGLNVPVGAQDPSRAAEIAKQQDAQDGYRRLSSICDELAAAQVDMQKKIAALTDEVQRLRDQTARANNNSANYATVEEVKRLESAITELDRNRKRDKELILAEFEKIVNESKKLVREPAPLARERQSAAANTPPKDEKGYYYKIKPNDRLDKIVKALNEEGMKVTLDQILKANPRLKPDRLIAGNKIFIPKPAKE